MGVVCESEVSKGEMGGSRGRSGRDGGGGCGSRWMVVAPELEVVMPWLALPRMQPRVGLCARRAASRTWGGTYGALNTALIAHNLYGSRSVEGSFEKRYRGLQ